MADLHPFHAKTHGVVTGRLTVSDDLPPELTQGLFAQPGSYGIVLRYSNEPAAIETDTVAHARGGRRSRCSTSLARSCARAGRARTSA